MKNRLLSAGLLALAVVAAPLPWEGSASAQCAMCKTALTSSDEGRALAHTFNIAILVMLAAPYVTFGSIAAFLFRGRIRAVLGPLLRRRR